MPFGINPPHEISIDRRNQDGSSEEVMTTIDTSYTTDIFTSYRSVNDEQWSDPVNNTNDSLFNKVTWLPNVIPSIHTVPIIQHITPIVTNPNHPLYGYPLILNMQIADLWPYVVFSVFDATTGQTSVETKEPAPESVLLDPRPNPASSYADIDFNLKKSAKVRLAIYNALGQVVKTLVDGYQPAGVHGVSVNLASFAPGTYYYALTIDGQTFTKTLNVVK